MKPKQIAILISGTGSNMEKLIEAVLSDSDFGGEVACVISDNPSAQGLKKAQKLGIKTVPIARCDYRDARAFETQIDLLLHAHQIDLVCLAGFMRVLSPFLCARWQGRMVNIHPSLLPAFKGLDTHQRVLESGAKFSGCTIHWVSVDLDGGEIISQAVVPVLYKDTKETLAQRVLRAEHRLYSVTLKALCQDQSASNTHSKLAQISFYMDTPSKEMI